MPEEDNKNPLSSGNSNFNIDITADNTGITKIGSTINNITTSKPNYSKPVTFTFILDGCCSTIKTPIKSTSMQFYCVLNNNSTLRVENDAPTLITADPETTIKFNHPSNVFWVEHFLMRPNSTVKTNNSDFYTSNEDRVFNCKEGYPKQLSTFNIYNSNLKEIFKYLKDNGFSIKYNDIVKSFAAFFFNQDEEISKDTLSIYDICSYMPLEDLINCHDYHKKQIALTANNELVNDNIYYNDNDNMVLCGGDNSDNDLI